jgi:Short C-terminal domain
MRVVTMKRIPVIATAILVMFMISGCGMTKSLFHRQSSEKVTKYPGDKTLWHFRYQYVRIESKDACPGGTDTPNSHPAQLSPDTLNSALASLRIIAPHSEGPIPLFNAAELNQIVGPVSAGFSRCSANEDVTFAVLGAHRDHFGYQNVVTAGRLFLVKNQLNLILGSVHRPTNDNGGPSDYRSVSFPQGSRCSAVDFPFTILVSPPAIQLHDQAGAPRKDWVVMDLSKLPELEPSSAPEGPIGVSPRQTFTEPDQQPYGPASTATSAPAAQPEAPHGQQAPPSRMHTAPARPDAAPVNAHTLEERLEMLKRLHDKNIITDEDYKEKKKELLNEL